MESTHHTDVLQWDVATLSNAFKRKQVSPAEVTRTLLEQIDRVNPELNAYITVMYEQAMESAVQAEREIAAGHWKGPLHGVPIGVKDLIYTKGVRTTMGSEIFKEHVPDFDATAVEKLTQAGAVMIGKLNTHEFAYGPTGDRSAFGAVKNPHHLSKISGGSSSGSGAAVSAALCYAALGTDTGGSIRIPSSCCGIVGMKPTFGRVSKYGVYPLSWTLDHVGPMTRTVLDNALLLNVLSGYDERDPYSIKTDAEDFTRFIGQSIKGSVIGVPSSFYFDNVEEEVEQQVRHALKVFESLGAEIRVIDLPHIQQFSLAHQITIRSEAYAVHEAMLRDRSEQYDPEVRERLLTGMDEKAHAYVHAQQLRHVAVQEFKQALNEADVIVTPTIPILPPDIGQRQVHIRGNKEHVRSALLRLTGPTNLNGFPSISVPCGFSESGLPIGMQLIGKPFDEANLYRFAYAFEQESSISTVKIDIV
jgi:aspartyl-tRNA(Asn)/glutamyl-tRNA(Gln) amidotransferase subunit A